MKSDAINEPMEFFAKKIVVLMSIKIYTTRFIFLQKVSFMGFIIRMLWVKYEENCI